MTDLVNGAQPKPMSSNTDSGTGLTSVPRKHPGRWVMGGGVLAVLLAIVWAFITSPNIAWSAVGEYLFNSRILRGVQLTIVLTIISQTLGVIGGVILAVMGRSPNPVFRWLSAGFIWIFRGTPLLIQIILWYNLAIVIPSFGLSIPGTNVGFSFDTNTIMTPIVAAIIALGLNESAYMAEIVRGGLLAVDHGQEEAARALGMRRSQSMRRIILPQAIRVIVPPTGNELINMLKNTSLLSVIAVQELLTSAQQIYASNFLTVELLFVASIWYLALSTIASYGQSRIEKRFGRSDAISTRPRQKWNAKPKNSSTPAITIPTGDGSH